MDESIELFRTKNFENNVEMLFMETLFLRTTSEKNQNYLESNLPLCTSLTHDRHLSTRIYKCFHGLTIYFTIYVQHINL